MTNTLTRPLVFLLLGIVLAKGLYSASVTGQTTDETYYIGPGAIATRTHHYAIMEQPPLAMQLGAFPLLFLKPELPVHDPVYLDGSHEIDNSRTGTKFLYAPGQDPYRILFLARMPIVLLTVLLGAVVFLWGSQLYGNAGALFALGLFALEPNLTAHGSLFTSDMTLTTFLFLAVYQFQKLLKEPTPKNLLMAGVATGLALLSKISSFLLFPLFLGAVLLKWVSEKNSVFLFENRGKLFSIFSALLLYVLSLSHRIPGALFGPLCLIPAAYFLLEKTAGKKVFWLAIFLLIGAWIGTWLPLMLAVKKASPAVRLGALGWGISLLVLFGLGLLKSSLREWLKIHSLVWVAAGFVIIFGYTDFPQALIDFKPFAHYLGSFGITTSHMARFHVHCDGGAFIVCDWRYFITCMAAKTSLVTLALFFLGAFAIGRAKLPFLDKFFVIAPPLGFLAAASFLSRINIGLRHVLPVYPFLILAAGFSLPFLQRLKKNLFRKVALAVLAAGVAGMAVRYASIFPNDLAYFSEWVGGPLGGAAMTSDSNIDWAQDNRKVFELAKKLGIPELKLGMTTGLDREYNYHQLPWKSMASEDYKTPTPGYYVLDLRTYLQQQQPGSGFYQRKPDFKVGATRYIFHIQ